MYLFHCREDTTEGAVFSVELHVDKQVKRKKRMKVGPVLGVLWKKAQKYYKW